MTKLGSFFNDPEVKESSQDFTPPPRGTYPGIVTDAEWTETGPNSKNPGTPMLTLEWSVLATDENGDERKVKAWSRHTLSPKAANFFRRTLIALGYTEDEITDPDFDPEPEEFVSREARLVCVPDHEYDSINVKKVLPPASSTADLP